MDNVQTFLDKLISNEGYDFAVISFKNRPPMAIESAIATNVIEGDSVVVKVATGPHPIHEGKRAAAQHYLPLNEITGITYYTESKIVKPGVLKSL